MDKELAQEILEKLYYHAWGSDGSFELRRRFWDIAKVFRQEYKTGDIRYLGNNQFYFEEDKTDYLSQNFYNKDSKGV